MSEREIPQSEWHNFCDRFAREHRGWLVEVNVDRTRATASSAPLSDVAARELAHNEPLQSLTAIPNPHGISVLLQAGDEDRTTRVLIERPIRVRLQQTESGADKEVCIDAADGQTTHIAFRIAARPETLNGLTDTEFGPPAGPPGPPGPRPSP